MKTSTLNKLFIEAIDHCTATLTVEESKAILSIYGAKVNVPFTTNSGKAFKVLNLSNLFLAYEPKIQSCISDRDIRINHGRRY